MFEADATGPIPSWVTPCTVLASIHHVDKQGSKETYNDPEENQGNDETQSCRVARCEQGRECFTESFVHRRVFLLVVCVETLLLNGHSGRLRLEIAFAIADEGIRFP